MDCLLVCPPRDTRQFYFEYPVLGVGYLASCLINKGLTVEIYDPDNDMASPYTMAKIIKRKKARIIGLSITYHYLRFFRELVKELRRIYPQGIIVGGGPHVTSDPEIINGLGLDYGFRGEAEFSFADFCMMIKNNESVPDNYPGLVVRRNGVTVINPPIIINDINQIPYPAYHLYNLKRYRNIIFSAQNVFTMAASRGCPFKCNFCDKLTASQHRQNDVDYVIGAIKELIKMGIRNIAFVDETFTLNRKWVVDFCNSITNEQLNFEWGCWTRADCIDYELLALMRRTGLKRLYLGVETGNEQLRFNVVEKKITNSTFKEMLKYCKELGIITECTYILGHPFETADQMQQTIDFAIELDSDFAYFFSLHVIPNSGVFEVFKEQYGKGNNYFRQFMLGQEEYPIYTPYGIGQNYVVHMLKTAYKRFYNRKEKQEHVMMSSFIRSRL
jgi:anaerobic magnesium-protoporphyrin IX monomethyl ester cyclase